MSTIPTVSGGDNPWAVPFTWFERNDAPVGHRQQMPWDALCTWVATGAPHAATKNALPLIKFATFRGDHRANATMETVYGVEGDYDAEKMRPDIAASLLTNAGITALIYTSPSHHPDRPRWRVVCPLSRPAIPSERHRLVARLNGALGGVLASESFTLSQAFYVGSVEGGEPIQCWKVAGRFLDIVEGLIPNDPPDQGSSQRKPLGSMPAQSLDAAVKALYSIDPNDLDHPHWLNVTAAFRQSSTGHAPDDMIRMLWDGWCAIYVGNSANDNSKLWRSLDGGTNLGWSYLRDHASPEARASLILGNRDAVATTIRNMEDILNDAAKLTPDTADAATALCIEAGTLPPIHRDTVLNAIRAATNIRMPTLRAASARASNDSEPDHLALARLTLATAGIENVIHAEHHFWIWEGRGIWNKRDDIAIKKQVQATLETNGCGVTAAKVSSVTDVLRNEIYRPDHAFNIGNPDVVNCLSGELELGNGGWLLQPHRREHYRTTQIPVAHDQHATAPMFLAFLTDVFRDDHDRDHKIWALLELIGYTLMSHARHERFIMLIGGGANGKSVLLAVIEALAGMKNVAGVQPAKFSDRFQRAHLYQKLANIVTELKQGEIIADAELKAITSGELTTVEFKHADPFDMRAFATCWFGTNHLPHTRDFSDALFRRATIVTFNRTFSEAEQDHSLKDKLITELPGILNLALYSYARAAIQGFTAPPSSIEAKQKWRMEADQVAQFVEERCVIDPSGVVTVSEIYRVFDEWARRSGVRHIVGKQAMSGRLEMLGFARKRSDGSLRTGLRLKVP